MRVGFAQNASGDGFTEPPQSICPILFWRLQHPGPPLSGKIATGQPLKTLTTQHCFRGCFACMCIFSPFLKHVDRLNHTPVACRWANQDIMHAVTMSAYAPPTLHGPAWSVYDAY